MMKMAMMATLTASPLPAAAGPPSERPARQTGLEGEHVPRPRSASTSELPKAGAVQPDEPRKEGKSTGDKILTGAAVVLGVGALAAGGPLVAGPRSGHAAI